MVLRINVTPGDVRELLNSLGRITVSDKITAGELTDEEIQAVVSLFLAWADGQTVSAGDLRQYQDQLYQCIQDHTTQADWTPDITPALWTIKSAPGIIPAWVQPTGAQDAYDIGDQVTHIEKTWVSGIDANTTVPGENTAFNYWTEV